jgi:hypothetical protein
MKFPAGTIELNEAAKKFGSTWGALRRAIYRKRLNGFKVGLTWFSTESEVKRYLKTRNVEKIPVRYRKKT